MTTIRDDAMAELETEITSYIDQLAEVTQDRDEFKRKFEAALAQLAHAKATGEVV